MNIMMVVFIIVKIGRKRNKCLLIYEWVKNCGILFNNKKKLINVIYKIRINFKLLCWGKELGIEKYIVYDFMYYMNFRDR